MARSPWFVLVEICVVIFALSGCGSSDAPEAKPAEATVTPAGAPPVAAPASLSTLEDQPVRATLHATDADDEVLRFAIVRAPLHATVSLDATTGEYTLQPDANYFGADAFEFTVTDGHGNAASARVEVAVAAQRDPPVIDTSAMASVVAAGREAQLHIAVSDPDGDAVTFSVSQVGSLPLPDLRTVGQEVRFLAPDIGAATTVELLLEATDRTGLFTQTREVITLSPVSPSGRLFTVQGRPRSEGLHWIITGDGFTADQQQDLMRTAIAMAKSVTGAPELARHSEVLNVHVLTAISRDSGVTTGASRAHRTAFDASLGCGDVERVACVDWDKVYIALLAERAPFDEVAVVLNTDDYIGSTSASGLIVSRNSLAPASTLHEMGHLLAGLGDEYVDDTLARTLGPQYREGTFPNVTTASDPARTPWRHWFNEAGVGRFEGAFYSANGFYRPKQDSIMKSLNGALGEVNAEAWLRALFRAVPPVSAAYPAHRVVAGRAGETVEFEIVSRWPSDLMATRWFVDGMEVEQARGTYRHALHADGDQHVVRVSIEDSSGRIRAPDAREHQGGVTWLVSNDSQIDAFKAQDESSRIGGWIRMRVDASGHSVLGLSTSEPQRGTEFRRSPDESKFEYALYDGGGAMLAEGRIADPRVVHGPLARPGAAEAGHHVLTLQSGYYLIGIPEGVDARRLRIRQPDGSMEKAAQSEQWLEL